MSTTEVRRRRRMLHREITEEEELIRKKTREIERLYLATQSMKKIANLTPEQNEIICKLLTGLNFRQISALIHKDELIVAQILYPAIVNRTILLRSPQPPFVRLPKISSNNPLVDIELENMDITDY
ncbi:MAG: hypothetical protein QNJ41_17955 [Xenococcaceae cyanobacterium MO_188.B32]|nr:hypothetical protein [Xenococcaceae cyanobacterium MO_188.B32]